MDEWHVLQAPSREGPADIRLRCTVELSHFRELFPILRTHAYLNTAAISPLPSPVAAAIGRHLEVMQHEPVELLLDGFFAVEQSVKEKAARLINAARADEIVQVPGTAHGMNIAAQSLPLCAGDNVLVVDGDYPAAIYPWLNLAPRGILTKVVPQVRGGLDLDVLEAHIDARTRVICLSTAMFATGYRNDMAAVGRLCAERDIFLVVDAIQTLGCLPVDVQAWNVAFLAAGSHKWLLGPTGSGLLYCRHDLIPRLQLGPYVGADSVVDPLNYLSYNFTLRPDSARFSVGVWDYMAWVAMDASLSLLLEVGIDRIAERVLALTQIAAHDLRARGFEILSSLESGTRTGILIFSVPDAQAAYEALMAQHVVTSIRGGGIRLSPNFYVTDEEVLRVGEILGLG